MPKVIPNATYDFDIADGKLKDAMTASAASNTNMMMVAPDQLVVLDGFNLRVTGTPEYEAGIREIADSIKENGFYRDKPFSVKVVGLEGGASGFGIMDGHRRYAGLQIALQEAPGCVELVPIVEVRKGTSLADATIAMMQTGTALTPFERSIGVARLVKAGLDDDMIAKRLAITKTYVNDLITIGAMPAKLKALIQDGKVSAGPAVRAYKEDPKTALARLTEAVETATARGKSKAAPKDIKGTSKATKDTAAAGNKPGRPPNPLKSEFAFEKVAGDKVPLAEISPFLGFGGGGWFILSEEEGIYEILQDVKITGKCVLKEKLPGVVVQDAAPEAPAKKGGKKAPAVDTSDL
jgi:ParB family chromosome partitioning protein